MPKGGPHVRLAFALLASAGLHGLLLSGTEPPASVPTRPMPRVLQLQWIDDTPPAPLVAPAHRPSPIAPAAQPRRTSGGTKEAARLRHPKGKPRKPAPRRDVAPAATKPPPALQARAKPEPATRNQAPTQTPAPTPPKRRAVAPLPTGRATARPPAALPLRTQRAWLARVSYPRRARRHGWQGTVVLSIAVRGGLVRKVDVLRGSGHALLDRAARRAIKQAPADMLEDGDYRLPVLFRLR